MFANSSSMYFSKQVEPDLRAKKRAKESILTPKYESTLESEHAPNPRKIAIFLESESEPKNTESVARK